MRLPALCLVCATSAFAQPAPTDFIPPGSKVLIGIDLRRMIESAQLPDLSTDRQSLSALMLAQNGLANLDPLKDVDSILIASTGEGPTPPTIAILSGRFGKLKLAEQKNAEKTVALAGDSILLAGDAAIVRAAFERPGAPPALAARILSLSSRFDIWGTGDNPKGFAAAKTESGGFDAVDHFEFGASFHKGLSLEAEFHVKSPQDAKKLTESLKFFEAMLKGDRFNMHVQNGTLKLAVTIPEEELKKAMAAQKTAFAAGLKAAPKPDPHGKIVTNAAGDTVSVTLPGGH